MRVFRDTTIATIVDIQERLHPHMHDAEQVLAKVVTLIRGLAVLDVPTVVTEQYPKGLGTTVAPVQDALGDRYRPIIKSAFSCCDEQTYSARLKEYGRSTILLAGIETHVCVLQTTIDLLESGYDPVVVMDATSSRSARDQDIASRRIEREGGRITSVESVLFEIARVSGTEQFKAISQLVK
ncbi:MAG TPA: hydrolase [Alkalispirochaeta sp.]|nr:hydrolase [Alkalispirochaeta sp.]